MATSSTRYFPRATSALCDVAALCASAERHVPKKTRAEAPTQTTPIPDNKDLRVKGIGFSSRARPDKRCQILLQQSCEVYLPLRREDVRRLLVCETVLSISRA